MRSREMSHWIVGNKPVVGEVGEAKFELRILYEGERKTCDVPHIPQSVRASPMMPASFASFGASALVDSARMPARCCRRALACKIGINTLAPYWMSCDIQSTFEDMNGKETQGRDIYHEQLAASVHDKGLPLVTARKTEKGTETHSLPFHVLR